MTNMLKLDQHQPIFTSPADANSFIYSPGLEYICLVLLKPLGLHLDIRFCRAVNVGLGLLTGLLAALVPAVQASNVPPTVATRTV